MERKHFIKTLGITSLVIPSITSNVFAQNHQKTKLDRDLVMEFVGAAHGKFNVVKELLAEHPTLLNAAHDWRYGDFETGLGAASHVGNKEVAKYLLDNGAQANIFTAALFGRLEILKPMLEFNPELINAKGPHGLTLLHHANQGGHEAFEVKEYLKSKGLKETQFKLY